MRVYILELTSEIPWAITVTTMYNHFISHQFLNQAFLCSWVGAVCKAVCEGL